MSRSKYANLTRHLETLAGSQWTASFDEIESALGFCLPDSAARYPAWWANQSGSGHVQSNGWQNAGWKTRDLDLGRRKVTFFRAGDDLPHEPASAPIPVQYPSAPSRPGFGIAHAKAGLAAYFGVTEEDIGITIKG